MHRTKLSFSRVSFTALLCVGVFLLGNCCALGLMTVRNVRSEETRSCCAARKADSGPAKEQPQKPCCNKGAAATPLPEKAKLPDNDCAPLLAVMPHCAEISPLFPMKNAAPVLLDTGPPRAASFAELVLQRCVLSHAPPVVV